MCIAIYKPETMLLSEDTLKNSWDNNPDGAGFMYVDNGQVIISKGYMSYKSFREAYDPHASKQMAVHFRIATHGKVDGNNTHPFRISDTLGLIHNGIISNVKCDIDKDMSDTWHFVERFMKKYEHLRHEPEFKMLIEKYIGASKLVTLDGNGTFDVYNEDLGVWDCDCWFSNKSYSYVKAPPIQYRGHGKYEWQKDFDDDAWSTPKKTQPETTGLSMGKELRMLAQVSVIVPDYTGDHIPKDAKVILTSFGQGNSLWVKYPVSGKTALVATWEVEEWKDLPTVIPSVVIETIEKDKDIIFVKNYNHFRIGDVKRVKWISGKNVAIIEPETTKVTHMVPRDCVEPASILFQ